MSKNQKRFISHYQDISTKGLIKLSWLAIFLLFVIVVQLEVYRFSFYLLILWLLYFFFLLLYISRSKLMIIDQNVFLQSFFFSEDQPIYSENMKLIRIGKSGNLIEFEYSGKFFKLFAGKKTIDKLKEIAVSN